MIIKEIIQKHPEYDKLKFMVRRASNSKDVVLQKIEIKGIPFSLQEILIDILADDINLNIIYASRDSLEIRKYFNTVQTLDLNEIRYSDFAHILSNHGFYKTPKVLEPAGFSVLGDTVIFWPIGMEHPIRVSFFGENAENASIFDEIYGSTINSIKTAIIGDIKELETKVSFEQIRQITKFNEASKFTLLFGGDYLDTYESKENVVFDFQYPQLYFQRFDLLEKDIQHKIADGYKVSLYTKHKESLPSTLQKYALTDSIDIEAGFITPRGKFILLTDRELYGTVFLNKATSKLTSDRARRLLAQLEGEIDVGDYIGHEDHGIGIYAGLSQEKYEQKISAGFNKYVTNVIYEDYILIKYAEQDELYVPINQINKITKYIGTDAGEPQLTRLGKNEWNVYKKKVKESVAMYAKELVSDLAEREIATAPILNAQQATDYESFVRDFPYTETQDQIRSEREVLLDMQTGKPMNRLIVGDVGFGKTEIAMRAAFTAVQNGKQVLVLCPTTVLAAQHENVFRERFKNFSITIAGLSRFTKKDHKKFISEMAEGKIDIVIGTHRLLSNDIKVKDLGLLIIDEEQKFGVKQKEKIKKLKYGVHVLSMSATPIPRTLSMALSSIWDISLIETPPEGRKAVKTIVRKINWNEIVESIHNEVKRGGQVYFLHNSVETIQSTFTKLQNLMPDVRFVFAHGQMEPSKLEKAIEDFYAREFDCLICTTIIENGIDMQNVNTIIIEHAQNFGLAQLYQLRGRVGRGDKQAYAYLFYDGEDISKKDEETYFENPKKAGQYLIIKAKQRRYKERLKALIDAEALGSGFNIASRDLEIRGAGNLLGKQQHGSINYIGYGLYMQLLAQEIERLKAVK